MNEQDEKKKEQDVAHQAALINAMAKSIVAIFEGLGFGRPSLMIAFTLSPDYDRCHWLLNVSRQEAIKVFRETASKLEQELRALNN